MLLYPILRLLSKFTRILSFDFSLCQESIISYYSLNQDKKLYPSKQKGYLINIGAGGFRDEKWINYDFPAQTDFYKKIQGKLYKDFFLLI